jgi:ribosomal protein S18 acetylase RimI-like enzyme
MPSGSALRPAAPSDADRLWRIAQAAYSPYVSRMDRRPAPMSADYGEAIRRGRALVLVDEAERVLGFVIHFAHRNSWFVENLAVDPNAQGGGVGSRLLRAAEDAARAAGAQRVLLYTNVVMAENVAFYEGRGYRQTMRMQDGGYDRLYFEKPFRTGARVDSDATSQP